MPHALLYPHRRTVAAFSAAIERELGSPNAGGSDYPALTEGFFQLPPAQRAAAGAQYVSPDARATVVVVQMFRSHGRVHVDAKAMDAYFRAAENFCAAATRAGGLLAKPPGRYAARATSQQGMLHEARDSSVADLEHSDEATVPAALVLVVCVVGAPALVVLTTHVFFYFIPRVATLQLLCHRCFFVRI